MTKWQELSKQSVLEKIEVGSEQGLSGQEVRERLERYGANEYQKTKKDGVMRMILHQFKDMANVILVIAVILSFALALREGHGFIEPLVILAVIIMNFTLAITQERSAEKALEALAELNTPTCFVLREGEQREIHTKEVVPGDILLLKTGDYVPADARLLQSTGLYLDESSLTGESEPAEKDEDAIVPEDAPLGDWVNTVFSGCLVTAGNGTAVVTATGMVTQMGKIAGYLNNTQKLQTPLQKRLNRLSKLVSVLAVLAAAVLLLLGVRQGEDFWVMMLAAVSLAVAAVPEMLQLIVTLTLTTSVKKMIEKNALIRKLPAVETLGNTSIICSDKTGTLTMNQMQIKRLWLKEGEVFSAKADFTKPQQAFLQKLALASNATLSSDENGKEVILGDATESAIIRLLLHKGENRNELIDKWPKVGEVPFSSERKMMTSIHKCLDGGYLVLTKGAMDRLPFKESMEEKAKRKEIHDSFAQQAMRVIALGSKKIEELPADNDFAALEEELEFVGLIGLMDPPKEEVKEAIKVAKRAGIRTIMITGDHAATAKAIAQEIGILGEGEQVITGKQLATLTDEELTATITDYSVYARVSPEDKIRIVEAWQEHDEVVSMTGDGVNDAPALKAADVGVAMGVTGTEVAKNAADMVLTDDNFATIIGAVREGRNVYSNIRKTIYFLLVCNISEIFIMLLAQMMGFGIVLTPVMLLLINVLGDGIPGLQLAKEESNSSIMRKKPVDREASFLDEGLLKAIIQQALAFVVVGLLAYYLGAKTSHSYGQTLTFIVVAFTSILHIFTVRSKQSIFKSSLRKNMPILYSALAMIVLFTLLVSVPPVARLFGLEIIKGSSWLAVIILSILPTIVAEIVKYIDNRCRVRLKKNRLVTECKVQNDW